MKYSRLLLLIFLATVAFLTDSCRKSENIITSFADAKYAKIGVMTGSTGEEITRARLPNAQIESFDDIMDAVAALKSGQLDAIVTGYPATLPLIKKNQEFTVLSEPLANEDTAIAIKKGNDALLADVNKIIAELKADGTLESMKKRWFKTDLSPYEQINIALPTQGEVLKVGVSATREPFSFVDINGKISGHDGELARLIASRLQRPIEFSNMKFMSLIPALQSGKIDLIATGMTASKERKKYVNFSEPYFANAQLMMVKKPEAVTAAVNNAVQTQEISKLSDLDGKIITVLTGSAGDLAARKHFPKATFQAVTAAADAALAVKMHKADAFVYDKSVLLNLVKNNPGLVILDEPVSRLEIAAAIKKDNVKLWSEIDQSLSKLKAKGVLKELRAKWVDSHYAITPVIQDIKNSGENGILHMGTCALVEPFSFHAEGSLTGMDIELARLIGAQLGKKIEILDMNFEALIPALDSGKIDFALSNFNVTEERKKLVLFSQPYNENDISALVRAPGLSVKSQYEAGQQKFASVNDLKDKRIGVIMGSAHDTYASKNYPNASIFQYKSPADVILAVKSQKVDAALYDEEPLREILRDDQSLAILGEPLFLSSVAIGFNKSNQELKAQFNAFLGQIRQNGVYNDMVDRWMKKGDTSMPKIDQPKSDSVLVVGTSDSGYPFTMVKNNQLVGFDIELSERFAASIGKRAQFSNMEFGSLIAAVSTRKIDMIASSLYVTDERKKQIDFSAPYYEMATRLFVLKENIAAQSVSETLKSSAPKASFLSSIANSFQSNIIQEDRYLLIWDGLKTTVIISIFSILLGTLLGAQICFMRMSNNVALNLTARIYISILRGTPVLVLLMLIFYVVFASVNISPVLVAVIAFGMNSAAYLAEVFRSGIESVDKGQIEAAISMGFNKFKTFGFIVLPQTLQRILPVYKGEFISLVKMTSIVGYIAVQDLTKASDIIRSRTFDAFFPLIMVAALYFLISWILMQSLEYLERITDPKYKRQKRAKS